MNDRGVKAFYFEAQKIPRVLRRSLLVIVAHIYVARTKVYV